MRSISKYYERNKVLDNVDFHLKQGEIHALLGENGAGKTTLMNILCGLTQPTAGELFVQGRRIHIRTPRDSTRAGIGMVHQHFLLVPAFTVEENLMLAGQQTGVLLDRQNIVERSAAICDKLRWTIPFRTRVSDLAVGVQQCVEILKALLADVQILLFDEPTAVLTPNEVDDLLIILRTLRDEGRSLVFVSHKLGEVMALCDTVTVLRRGRVVANVAVADTDPGDLARRMVGDTESADRPNNVDRRSTSKPQPGLRVKAVTAPGRGQHDVSLQNLEFHVPGGQIIGFAGVDGNGQEELFELLAGLRAYAEGTIDLDGKRIGRLNPGQLLDLGISVVPPDRQRQGLALTLSIRDNLVFDAVRDKRRSRTGLLNNRSLDRTATSLQEEYDVRTVDISLPASSLSGGNQQKIVIARALSRRPRLVVAASPTRGLDVAATAYVHEKLRRCRDDGAAIVLISAELDEIFALSDRIAVLYEGRVAAIVAPDISRRRIGLLMGGKNIHDTESAEPS